MLKLIARASSASEIIFTFAIITAALIGFGWFFSNYFYQKPVVQTIDSDLTNLVLMLEDACFAYSYSDQYNPLIEEGVLTIVKENAFFKACLSSKGNESCKKIACSAMNQTEINLGKISALNILKLNGGAISVTGKQN